ncbi:MAG: tRNA (adenosine(37)-N6)-threonylcarbamoyltransferase complex dimerization subunit type 1 TsaB [Methylophilaceae bacterium]|jgi:tRNA threonylcarbamoyladenosine biosynthesis protein TsaB|nr:tRNA (adenosine(37)-N6)-threonylcarbamoyltransferase complex dimerization subunit type 1 TsaB [Methylophilaceae bacterium]MDG1453038.1 tRNA (adenosine(37)-N6)-threonylcarbamoyltransferase complex dimerization subunit type 1 TsaB [Methylophilaceae bacterium]
MKLLAFDASTEFLSIALQTNKQVETLDILAGQTASQLILPQIQGLLDKAQLILGDLDGIAFGAGPGSFTGVRIACGVAQGLAFGANLPVVGINVLMALAEASGAERVIAASDARMGEVYHAAYMRKDDGWMETHAAGVYKPQDVPAVEGGDWVGVGTAWKVYDETLREQYQQQVSKTLPEMTPKAEAIMRLAMPMFARGEAVSASKAAPIYIRNRVALTSKEREQGLRL